jgi:predicted RNase H-like HicB family nuclease
MRYAIVIEKGPVSFGAYVPDLPGCVAAAESRDEVL